MPKLSQTTKVEVDVAPEILEQAEQGLRLYAELKRELERVKGDLGALVEQAGVNLNLGKDVGSIQAVKGGTSSRLNKKKLLTLGVKLSTIDEATVTTPKKPYTVVRVPGDPEEPTDE